MGSDSHPPWRTALTPLADARAGSLAACNAGRLDTWKHRATCADWKRTPTCKRAVGVWESSVLTLRSIEVVLVLAIVIAIAVVLAIAVAVVLAIAVAGIIGTWHPQPRLCRSS